MAILVEKLLRNTNFNNQDKQIILRGIAQLAASDGNIDPREREYLKQFVTEYFPSGDPTDPALTEQTITANDVGNLSSHEAQLAFLGFLTITAYSDEDYSQPERKFIRNLVQDHISEEEFSQIQWGVRKMLYRRVVFSFALKNKFLHPDFAMEMARRFDISNDEAVEINQGVFSAIMAIKGDEAQEASQ